MTIEVNSALTGTIVPVRVREIIRLESEADKLASDYDANRWKAAELISQELAGGKSQRQLGGEIGKSHSHVGRMARSWNLKVPGRSFNEIYNSPEVRGVPAAQPRPAVPPGPSPASPSPRQSRQERSPPAVPPASPRGEANNHASLAWNHVSLALEEIMKQGRPASVQERQKIINRLSEAIRYLEGK